MTEIQGQGAPEGPATISLFGLWRDPLVCVSYLGGTSKAAAAVILAIASGRSCHILAPPYWRMASQLEVARDFDQWLKEEHPNARLTVMAATEADARLVSDAGVDAIWASHTALIDERIYYPELDEPKIYDAVHNANTRAFKRHELAHGVNNLALVTYQIPGRVETFAETVAGYRNLAYANYSQEGGHRMLDGAGVRHVLSQARCGLILSALEGANNASMEYFLCGLPLVTTPSEGGREEMYDPRHVTIVEPNAEAVEAAVAAYQAWAPDPLEIRASALAKARAHRARLIAWLSGVVGRDLLPLADHNLWLPQFRDKLVGFWRTEPRPGGGLNAHPM